MSPKGVRNDCYPLWLYCPGSGENAKHHIKRGNDLRNPSTTFTFDVDPGSEFTGPKKELTIEHKSNKKVTGHDRRSCSLCGSRLMFYLPSDGRPWTSAGQLQKKLFVAENNKTLLTLLDKHASEDEVEKHASEDEPEEEEDQDPPAKKHKPNGPLGIQEEPVNAPRLLALNHTESLGKSSDILWKYSKEAKQALRNAEVVLDNAKLEYARAKKRVAWAELKIADVELDEIEAARSEIGNERKMSARASGDLSPI